MPEDKRKNELPRVHVKTRQGSTPSTETAHFLRTSELPRWHLSPLYCTLQTSAVLLPLNH